MIYKAPGNRHPLSPISNIKNFYCGLRVKQATIWITSLASSSCMSQRSRKLEKTLSKKFCLFVFKNERNSFNSRKDLILIYLNTELIRRDQIQLQFRSGERVSTKTHSFRKKKCLLTDIIVLIQLIKFQKIPFYFPLPFSIHYYQYPHTHPAASRINWNISPHSWAFHFCWLSCWSSFIAKTSLNILPEK